MHPLLVGDQHCGVPGCPPPAPFRSAGVVVVVECGDRGRGRRFDQPSFTGGGWVFCFVSGRGVG